MRKEVRDVREARSNSTAGRAREEKESGGSGREGREAMKEVWKIPAGVAKVSVAGEEKRASEEGGSLAGGHEGMKGEVISVRIICWLRSSAVAEMGLVGARASGSAKCRVELEEGVPMGPAGRRQMGGGRVCEGGEREFCRGCAAMALAA